MPNWVLAAGVGLAAGLVAAGAMEAYQNAAAKPFGQDEGDGDPATVQAAEAAALVVTGVRLPKAEKDGAGRAVHYLTGAALGVGYALLARRWPATTALYGVGFGIATSVVLDELAVPALGWGDWPTETPLDTHLYSLTAHAVFGAALEGGRRAGLALAA